MKMNHFKRSSSLLADKKPLPPFQWMTFGELGVRVLNTGKGLRQLIQAREFVAICTHVQLHGYIADYACQTNSIIGPILGPNLSAEAFVHIINSTQMKLVFCAKTLTTRFLELASQCPTLRYIVQLEDLSEYQKRPKVEAAKQGLRESAKKNFLRNSIKPSSSASVPVSTTPSNSTDSSSKNDESKTADANVKSGEAVTSEPSPPAQASEPTTSNPSSSDRSLHSDVDFGALLQSSDIEAWKETLFESGGPILLCLSDLERLGEMVEDVEEVITGPDELETLVYTSGSTGIPKGAMFTASSWRSQLCHQWASSGIDTSVTWSISDRKNDYRHLYYGGAVAIYNGNMARIFDDIAEIKPDQLNATPAFWNKIYAEFKAELTEATKHMVIDPDSVYESSMSSGASLNSLPPILNPNQYADPVEFKRIREELFAQFRALVGGRVEKIVTGGAPTSPEVLTFLNMCFSCRVRESYGSTECGGIVSAGLFVSSLNWKLVSWEEYTTEDQPFPRGELCVKRKDMMSGYYNETDLTAEALDSDGYYHTGDIVELNGAHNGAVIIDRKKNIFKLAQGEYVAPAKVEKLLIGNSPFIKQVFVYGDSLKSSLVAVIFPHKQVLIEHLTRTDKKNIASTPSSEAVTKNISLEALCKRADATQVLFEECGRIGRQFNLRTFEIPAALILTHTEFTKENGLQTQSDKPARHALLKHFAQDIEKLYRVLDSQLGETKDAVYQLFGKTLSSEVDLSAIGDDDDDEAGNLVKKLSFVQMGGDSLTAVKLRNMIKKEFDVALPVDILMNPDTDMERIATYIDESKRNKKTISNGTTAPNHIAVDVRTLMVDSKLDPQWHPAGPNANMEKGSVPPSDLPLSKWEAVFITGSTGFLGTALLAEILKSTNATVYCLVRPKKVKPSKPKPRSTSSKATKSDDHKSATAKDELPTEDLKNVSISPATQNSVAPTEEFLSAFESRLLKSGLLGDTIDSMAKMMKKTLRQRIVPVIGRLDSEDGYQFGIDDSTFEDLSNKVQVVIHAGAEVNTVLPYHRLAKSNVTGTKSCLNLCSKGKRKFMVHVSTTGLTQALQSRDEVPIVEELLSLYPRLSGLGGYNLSKLMAELVVWEALDRGYDVMVVRPGFIGSAAGYVAEVPKSSKSKGPTTIQSQMTTNLAPSTPFAGFSNQNDYDNRLIVGLTMMGIVPEDLVHLITFPVDFMAKCIVTMASKAEKTIGGIFHLTHNSSELTSELLVQGLQMFGFEIKKVPFSEWQQAARDMTDETNPIYPMVDEYFSHHFHRRVPYAGTALSQQFIADHVGHKTPRTDLPFVLCWISWLIKNGLLTPPTSKGSSNTPQAVAQPSAASTLFLNSPTLAVGSAIASTSMASHGSSDSKKDKSSSKKK